MPRNPSRITPITPRMMLRGRYQFALLATE
jgi:hypothetical protein